jgi:hypothetical protein
VKIRFKIAPLSAFRRSAGRLATCCHNEVL